MRSNHWFRTVSMWAWNLMMDKVYSTWLQRRVSISFFKLINVWNIWFMWITDFYNVVKTLLDNGVDPNILNSAEQTPLHIAAEKGRRVNLIHFLLKFQFTILFVVLQVTNKLLNFSLKMVRISVLKQRKESHRCIMLLGVIPTARKSFNSSSRKERTSIQRLLPTGYHCTMPPHLVIWTILFWIRIIQSISSLFEIFARSQKCR